MVQGRVAEGIQGVMPTNRDAESRGGSRSQASGCEGCDFSAWLCQQTAPTPSEGPSALQTCCMGGRPLWHSTKPITAAPHLQPALQSTPHLLAALQATCASGLPHLSPLPPTASGQRPRLSAHWGCLTGPGAEPGTQLPWEGVTQPHLLPRCPSLGCSPYPHPTPESTASNVSRGVETQAVVLLGVKNYQELEWRESCPMPRFRHLTNLLPPQENGSSSLGSRQMTP